MPRGSAGSIPRPDGDFNTWQANFIAAVGVWLSDQGQDLALFDTAAAAQGAWASAYPAHTSAQAAARAARAAKDTARETFERAIRPLAAYLQSDPRVTDAARATFGITVRSPGRSPAPAPASRPKLTVAPAARLTHRLQLTDESTPTRRGRPPGTVGAEVWVALVDAGGPVPTDPGSLSYLALATRPTLRATFPAGAGGKTAVYMLRWVSTRGERGPWSEVVGATVAA